MSDYGRLDVALIPSIPEQEAEAERQKLAGAATTPENQQSTPWAVPIDTTPKRGDEVDVQGGDSYQVPWKAPSKTSAGGVSEEHYYIHTVQETIDRGYFGFNSVAWNLPEDEAVQVLGLDDDRPRAFLTLLSISDDTIVYVGDRDVIDGAAPQSTGIWLSNDGAFNFTYRARKEIWAIAVGGTATLGVTSYTAEPNSDTLGARS